MYNHLILVSNICTFAAANATHCMLEAMTASSDETESPTSPPYGIAHSDLRHSETATWREIRWVRRGEERGERREGPDPAVNTERGLGRTPGTGTECGVSEPAGDR